MMSAAAMPTRRPQSEVMLTLLERHKVQVLLEAAFSATEVAERTGISFDTIRRVQREAAVTHTDDKLEHQTRRIGRPSLAAPFAQRISGWLQEEPDLPTQSIFLGQRGTVHGTQTLAEVCL